MPTVIALDVSISMLRPVHTTDNNEEYQLKQLAIHGINKLLDLMTIHCKLEFSALVVFSYLWEQLVAFTRDFESVRNALNDLTIYNKTVLATVLAGIETLITSEWGMLTPCQVIFVTDGQTGPTLLPSQQTVLPYRFPCKIHVVCVGDPSDPAVQRGVVEYEKMIEANGQGGEVFVSEGGLSLKLIEQLFVRLIQTHLAPYRGVLRCGSLKCNVQLYPPPLQYHSQDQQYDQKTVSNMLNICGFMDINDVASPASISRHLVLPIMPRDKRPDEGEGVNEDPTVAGPEEGRTPSFTVLLHGSLKVANMVAITQVSEDWYGMMYSWADSKKKSNLMISLYEPGPIPVSWLGNINCLGLMGENSESLYGNGDDTKSPFPVRPPDKRSYAQSYVVWIKAQGLQGDLQKVLRHARKLPEKLQQFYKEVNRIRTAAISFGFLDLLDALASMLDRECTILPGNTHPDAAIQLSHCANMLRSGDTCHDIKHLISPLITKFDETS